MSNESRQGRVVGFMLYGLLQNGGRVAMPVEFPGGGYKIFTSPEDASLACNELLTDPVQEWEEKELMAVPIWCSKEGIVEIPSEIRLEGLEGEGEECS